MSNISLRNLSVSFPQYSGSRWKSNFKANGYYEVLKDITLELKSGDRVGLLGHNGAGKSTLMRVLAGNLPRNKGEIHVEGNIFPALSPSQGMLPNASCYENIRLKGLFYGFRGEQLGAYVEAVCGFADIEDFLHSPLNSLSNGMRSRLHVATLCKVEPQILLMDEWIGAADDKVVRKNKGLLRELVEKSDIFVLASHRKILVKDFCTSAIVLDSGGIAFHGAIDEAFEFKQSIERKSDL